MAELYHRRSELYHRRSELYHRRSAINCVVQLRNESTIEQKYNDYHAILLPDFVKNLNQNVEKRIALTINVINKHVTFRSNPFCIPSNFLNKTKELIKQLVFKWTKVGISSSFPIQSLNEYKISATRKFHKKKAFFFGNYIFGPIIYVYLYMYLFNNSSALSLTKCLTIFIDIVVDISESQISIQLIKGRRYFPLIPYRTIEIDNKFKESSMFLLKYFNCNYNNQIAMCASANDSFFLFIESLRNIKELINNKINDEKITKNILQIAKNIKIYNEFGFMNQHPNQIFTEKERSISEKENEKSEEKREENKKTLIFISIVIIVIFLLIPKLITSNIWISYMNVNVESNINYNKEDLEFDQCMDLLTKHQLLHIWPKLIEERFDDISLWNSITFDMLEKMNIADSDKIRFENLQRKLKDSHKSLIHKIMEMPIIHLFVKMCLDNPQGIYLALTSAIIPTALLIVYKAKRIRDFVCNYN